MGRGVTENNEGMSRENGNVKDSKKKENGVRNRAINVRAP
jgi:hypothetical protein